MQVYAAQCHTSSVNSVSFAPHELGLVLAAASSDGSLSVLTHQPDGSWQTQKVQCPLSVDLRNIDFACTASQSLLAYWFTKAQEHLEG